MFDSAPIETESFRADVLEIGVRRMVEVSQFARAEFFANAADYYKDQLILTLRAKILALKTETHTEKQPVQDQGTDVITVAEYPITWWDSLKAEVQMWLTRRGCSWFADRITVDRDPIVTETHHTLHQTTITTNHYNVCPHHEVPDRTAHLNFLAYGHETPGPMRGYTQDLSPWGRAAQAGEDRDA